MNSDHVVYRPSTDVKVWAIYHEGLGTFSVTYSVQQYGAPVRKPYKSRSAAIKLADKLVICI